MISCDNGIRGYWYYAVCNLRVADALPLSLLHQLQLWHLVCTSYCKGSLWWTPDSAQPGELQKKPVREKLEVVAVPVSRHVFWIFLGRGGAEWKNVGESRWRLVCGRKIYFIDYLLYCHDIFHPHRMVRSCISCSGYLPGGILQTWVTYGVSCCNTCHTAADHWQVDTAIYCIYCILPSASLLKLDV